MCDSANVGLLRNVSSRNANASGGVQTDVVTDEVARWKSVTRDQIDVFKDKKTGLTNEFAMMYEWRHRFPLHYIVFKQVSSHLCHEGNTENLFSTSGKLAHKKKGRTR